MSTVKSVIQQTMKLVGILAPGQSPAAYVLADILEAMNMMLASWSSSDQSIYVVTRNALALTANQASYTIGDDVAADFNTTRPQSIFDSFLRITDTDFPVRAISQDQYDRITEKSEPGIPGKVYYEPTYPLGALYFYAVPREAYNVTLITLSPFPTYSIVDSFALPPGYERAIKFNLALEIAGNYGKQVSPLTAQIASGSFKILENTNLMRQTGIQQGLDPTGSSRGIIHPEELFT